MVATGALADRLSYTPFAEALGSRLNLAEFDDTRLHSAMPDWWLDNGNQLFLGEGIAPPGITQHPGLPPPKDALIVLAGTVLHLILWGERVTVAVGQNAAFHGCVTCGSATVAIGSYLLANSPASIDARNGGFVFVGRNGLWAPGVELVTDDMHAIRDLGGGRVNRFGGGIVVEERVWLGKETMVRGGATIGHDSVVGARSMVTRSLPVHSISAGVPAKVIREGIVWTHEDDE